MDINNIHDSKKIENAILELHENTNKVIHAKNAELYNSPIDGNKYIKLLVKNTDNIKFIKDLKILKSEPNLLMYDAKQFLGKHNISEYINDPNNNMLNILLNLIIKYFRTKIL